MKKEYQLIQLEITFFKEDIVTLSDITQDDIFGDWESNKN